MAVPANIAALVSSLNGAIGAAAPLADAQPSTLTVLATQAETLATTIESELSGSDEALDGWLAGSTPVSMIAGVQAALSAADEQLSLADLSGYIGRVAANLANG